MDAVTPNELIEYPSERWFLPALAAAIGEWFPELGGRSLAVSDMTPTKENTPTLPLCVTAFVRSSANPPLRNHYEEFPIDDAFIVEFWLQPMRYKKINGTETPFWTYYPYEGIRNKLLSNITQWTPPGKERIAFRTLNIVADAFAVVLTFGFIAHFDWCLKTDRYGMPFKVDFNLCTPAGVCIEDEQCEPCPDPCA